MADSRDPDVLRFDAAKTRRKRWDAALDEAYQYCLPQYAAPTRTAMGSDSKGEKRGAEVFDTTAEDALTEKAARTQDQLFPPFSEWTDFQPADPVDVDDEQQQQISEAFATARQKFHGAIEASNFHIEMPLAIRDAYISTGAVAVDFGTLESPLVFSAVPVGQVIPEESPDGVIRTNFRERKVKLRELSVLWPKAELPPAVAARVTTSPDEEIAVTEMEIFEPDTGDTRYRVFVDSPSKENEIIDDVLSGQRTVCFRVDKVPGETMGRGPALAKMPDIKTANKVVELTLKNAAIAVTGIWQADDDGVLNPANIKLVPGSIIPKAVGSSGLTPLEAPGRFDVSNLVLDTLRDRIERGIKGPSLPPADDAVRTAFELGERRADQRAVEVPQTLRLLSELYFPLVDRVLRILTHPSMAGSRFYIDDIAIGDQTVRPKPISPLVRLRDQAQTELALSAFAAVYQLDPEGVAQEVDMPKMRRWFLLNHAFPAELMRDPDTIAKERRDQAMVEGAARQGAEVAAAAINQQGAAGA
ncbi:MAG: portal protein [Rhodospirillales bacterium]|jgi:hypothetical protein|nr:portal protein [Rhodospirillales bacterium]